MRCCRIMALLLLLVFTACGVCSCFLPLFRASTNNSTTTIRYWYTDTVNTTSTSSVSITTRLHNTDRVCSVDRMCFTVAAALSTSGAALGGIAVLLAAMWVYSGRRMCVQHLVTWATFVSASCFVTTLSLTVFSYVSGSCTNDAATNTSAIKDLKPKHNVVEGFYLLCVATAGMVFSMTYMAFSYCCGDRVCCCCVVAGDMRSEYDPDSYSRRSYKSHHSSMSHRPSMSRHSSSMSRHSSRSRKPSMSRHSSSMSRHSSMSRQPSTSRHSSSMSRHSSMSRQPSMSRHSSSMSRHSSSRRRSRSSRYRDAGSSDSDDDYQF